ncbi:putative F-box domain, FBD domain, leucine-rich repeat domain superfamily [Helianthus annuus]|uniref:F-box domain, FBD domain, leucine-rich repeat domain superfamily n=2 Tax=Helianthus annuus TaxID=4232 RepID=A0A9K3DK85_HELAN|nr:putative F-box/FBD/LRR-repeat protein At1g78760 isoform X1 [Helianthus annuus]KAF5757117.1 putative F-box domain, FBD domain, leucine-rich repeat domain superfamily [Helianthus annuus]
MSSSTENVDDMLSMLPEDILSRILSLMPTKLAVRTSVLSKRWRYTWTSVTNLDIDYTRYHRSNEKIIKKFVDGNEGNFIKFVDRALKYCRTSHVKLFRLHVSNYHHAIGSSVSNWIDSAVRLNVRELDICVIQYELPLSVFTCNTLTSLRLELSACDFGGWEFPSTIYLPCLKTLDIVGCNNPQAIHGCCPVLESLSLEVSCNDEQDFVLNIPTLKWLKLICRSGSSNGNSKIMLRVPKLEYLFVDGVLCSFFEMEDVSSLVGASIACWHSKFDFLWADILNKLSGVQNLSIENFQFTSPLPIFPNMKQLELTGTWRHGQITQFLESCPELKILIIDFVDWRDFKKQKPEKSMLIPACMQTNLTTIKFSKCDGDTCDMKFLEYMLGNAQVLKTVTIFAQENLLIEEDPCFCAQVLKIPRASPHCEIRFRTRKLPPPQEFEYDDTDEAEAFY